MRIINKIYYLAFAFILSSCVIEDDIPYPIIDGAITSISVEGQRGAKDGESSDATIDAKERTVKIFVNDSVDITKLKITSLKITDGAELLPDSAVCVDWDNFPKVGFPSLDSVSSDANTRVNFSKSVIFKVKTYQKYTWKVSVEQIINRDVDVDGQVADAVIDPISRNVIIYVSPDKPLNNLKVNKMNLAGEYGRVEPDPTLPSESDYSKGSREFYVGYRWLNTMEKWSVFVYHKEAGALGAEAFAMATKAYLNGKIQSGKTPVVEYKMQSDANWSPLSSSNIKVSGNTFSATINGLKSGSRYQYRVSIDGVAGDEMSFTTAEATPLPNASFDDWSNEGKLWQPWASGGTSFWDTGNKGATTVGDSNSTPTSDTSSGSGQAASLESKYIVLKFAAGNIFSGKYVKTDGTNGVLEFGRPFSSFPSKLRINYKYNSEVINRIGDDAMSHLKGKADSCHVFIALTDWDKPLEIRTRPSERQLFNPSDSHVIAYGELIKGETVSSWTQADIELKYRYNNRTPKYILVVATASKYGDYFTGGEGSKLWLDNFELIYE